MPSNLVTDLVQIRRFGDKKRDENSRFRRYLKTHDHNDRRFRRIAEEIEEQIDCRQCANCCKVAATPITSRDIEHIARYLGIRPESFIEQYVEQSQSEMILRRTKDGCVFLDGNDCTVYDARPRNCVDFPHLVRGAGSIASRMWEFIDRASYCPIVYNAMESFKDETRFQR